MKIAVIGTIVRDEIHHFNGRVSHSLGGLLHTVQTLRALVGPNDEIFVFSFAGKDIREPLERLWTDASNVRTEGIRFLDQKNNYVRIVYHSPEERTEYSLSPLPPLSFELLQEALQCDVILLNMISGWDIQLPTLQKLRKKFHGILAVDVHSLLLGRAANGQRFFKAPEKIKRWLEAPDILQMNEQEFAVIFPKIPVKKIFLQDSCFEDDKILNLTFGSRGSRTVQKRGKRITSLFVEPPAGVTVTDPTGCGDAFMAGFCYEYVISANVHKAAQKANLVAALSGSFRGLAEPQQLMEKLKDFYG